MGPSLRSSWTPSFHIVPWPDHSGQEGATSRRTNHSARLPSPRVAPTSTRTHPTAHSEQVSRYHTSGERWTVPGRHHVTLCHRQLLQPTRPQDLRRQQKPLPPRHKNVHWLEITILQFESFKTNSPKWPQLGSSFPWTPPSSTRKRSSFASPKVSSRRLHCKLPIPKRRCSGTSS